MNFYTNLDLFKLLSTSVQDNINSNLIKFNQFDYLASYTSSINTSRFMDSYTGTRTKDQNVIISTVQFRLDTLSTFINKGAKITITYSPSLLYNFLIPTSGIANISTFIVAKDSRINEATFVRPWFVQTMNPSQAQPYLYTDTIHFTINSSNIAAALNSTFTIYHNLDLTSVSPTSYANLPVNVLTCSNNSFTIGLTGMNY
jgi:hypothetical protein